MRQLNSTHPPHVKNQLQTQ